MNVVLVIELVLTTISLISTTFVVFVHLIIKKLLRPPGDFIFTQAICQIFLSAHWYSILFLDSLPENSPQCKMLSMIQVFFSSSSINLVLCLCIEVKYKVSNRVFNQSKVRHICSYTLIALYSIFLIVFGLLNDDLGHGLNKTCVLKPQSLTSYIRFGGFVTASIFQIGLIFLVLKNIDRNYSKLTTYYCIFIVFVTISLILSDIFKILPINNAENLEVFRDISTTSGTCTGIIMSTIILCDKQIFKQLKWVLCKNKQVWKNELGAYMRSKLFGFDELFESLKKKTLLQMIIVVNLRMRTNGKKWVKIEKEVDYDEFIFEENLFDELSNDYGTRIIKDIYSPNLYLQEFAPKEFSSIRRHQKIEDSSLLESFSISSNINNLLSVQMAQGGSSQATIFFTNDKKYVIKTISESEKKFVLKSLMPKYYESVTSRQCYLVRILALFRLYPAKTSYIIMENTVVDSSKAVVFDIKGSTVNRLVPGEYDYSAPPYGCLLKDLNLIASKYKLELDEKLKESLLSSLRLDLLLLLSINSIDYSILLAFYIPTHHPATQYIIQGRGQTYSLSIIDYLQSYNLKKRSEKLIKKLYYKKQEFSVESPEYYSQRLLKFVEGVF